MTKEEIKDQILPIISNLAYTSDIQLESSLENDLYFDALDMVECMMYIEDDFNISIPEDKWDERVKTVNDVIEFVAEILEQKETNN